MHDKNFNGSIDLDEWHHSLSEPKGEEAPPPDSVAGAKAGRDTQHAYINNIILYIY